MKGSIKRYCFCRDPETGKEPGNRCPRLKQTKHGEWEYRDRLTTASGRKPFRRRGFATKNAAEEFQRDVHRLLDLARGDSATAYRIADLIFTNTKRGGQLPPLEDVRRRLGHSRDLDRSETFDEAWPAWLAGKKKLRPSVRNGYEQIGRNWLLPVLSDIAVDRLTGEHCAAVFERIDLFNEEIEAAREAGRRPVLPGDVRSRADQTGIATQHRIYAAPASESWTWTPAQSLQAKRTGRGAKRERLAAGKGWEESGRAFTTQDGRPLAPDYISRRFKKLASAAGLPVIKLHAARHTAASLMLEAGLDVKIVQEVLGHSTSAITRDTHQDVRRKVHKDAAEKVVALLAASTATSGRSTPTPTTAESSGGTRPPQTVPVIFGVTPGPN